MLKEIAQRAGARDWALGALGATGATNAWTTGVSHGVSAWTLNVARLG